MDNDVKLTVLIPTYNRKEKLLRTLESLIEQTNHNFNIIISDNCSNYSIEEVLSKELPVLLNKITIFHQPFNIGGTPNIIGALSLCPTEWGWILGDDDVVYDNAVEKIYNSINQYPDTQVFWFSIDEKKKDNCVIDNIYQLQDYLEALNNSGDFIFCSNKVFNITRIGSYMEITHRFSYTRISQCFPIIESLKENKCITIINSDNIVKHGGFEDGSITWDVSKTVSGLRTLMDYPTGLSWKKHCRLVKSIMFRPSFVLKNYFKAKLPWNYKNYLKNVYTSCYKYCYPIHKRLVIKCEFWIASIPFVHNLMNSYYHRKLKKG